MFYSQRLYLFENLAKDVRVTSLDILLALSIDYGVPKEGFLIHRINGKVTFTPHACLRIAYDGLDFLGDGLNSPCPFKPSSDKDVRAPRRIPLNRITHFKRLFYRVKYS